MFTCKSSIQYWSLEDSEKQLRDIIPLLKRDYSKSKNNMKYNHQWLPANNDGNVNNNFKIDSVNIEGINYNCIYAFAKIEMLQIASRFAATVERDVAITNIVNPVVFIEVNGSVKIIISASASCFSKIRYNLMKTGDKKTDLWGGIQYKNLTFDSDFFCWLFSKKGKKIEMEKQQCFYKILDVSGFKSHTDHELQSYEGNGNSLDTVVPVQAMLCLNNDFTGLSILMENENKDKISFFIGNEWDARLDTEHTLKMKNGKPEQYTDFDELILKFYLNIIPMINSNYNKDEQWKIDRINFKKRMAAKAIDTLLLENNIEISELRELLA